MKHIKILYIITILISMMFAANQDISAQYGFECGFNGTALNNPYINLNDFWGMNKPIRTDLSGEIGRASCRERV